jgi:3-oxoacyl-[acyl-carrier protein] reductase
MNQTNQAGGKLDGQLAIITGASSGIGRAIAQAFLDAGAHLIVVARRADRLGELETRARALGRRCQALVGDAREEETARRAVEVAMSDFGHIDILVNNVGIAHYKPLAETSAAEYDAMMNTNMRSTFLFTRHVTPILIEQGHGAIINVSSMAGVMGFPGEAVYCATKFAQVGFTQALDRELRPRGIKVGVVCPGGVKTEFAIGTGRTEQGVSESGMLEANDVAQAILLMATQAPESRIIEIRMRPMVEPLAGRDPE